VLHVAAHFLFVAELNAAAVMECPVDAGFIRAEAPVHVDTTKETPYVRFAGENVSSNTGQ
jgi:hypothetical protein